MTSPDRTAGTVLGEAKWVAADPEMQEQAKILVALAQMVGVGSEGQYASWQQRSLKDQVERVSGLLSAEREAGREEGRRECAGELREMLPVLNPRVGDLGAGTGVGPLRTLADRWSAR